MRAKKKKSVIREKYYKHSLHLFLLQGQYKFAVVAVGAPACGANAAIRSFVRMSLVQGYQVLGCHDSLGGLARGDLKPLEWMDVNGWAAKGGSMLGTKR